MTPKAKTLPRKRGPYNDTPWNDLQEPLKLYAAPAIKTKLGLSCETTVEYLERVKQERARAYQKR